MTVTLGAGAIGAVYLGATPVDAVYLGADLVWSATPPASDPYKAAVLADSPDLYVRLDKDTPVDESGNAHTLTAYSGTATFTSDPVFGDVLDGGSKAWSTDATPAGAPLSMEMVFYAEQTTVTQWRFALAAKTTGTMYGLGVYPQRPWIAVYDGTSNRSNLVHPGSWYHVAAVQDGTGNTDYYQNGTYVKSFGPVTVPAVTGAWSVATSHNDAGNTRLVGKIHSVSTYPHVLTAPQVAAHYAALPS